ncbi:MAG TPA: cation diffusion facilitator family transporter [Casimicrobiaceae bacterium]|nr:cation diffusion facilitator family transporter [Casimicrobiaceae bacterium]
MPQADRPSQDHAHDHHGPGHAHGHAHGPATLTALKVGLALTAGFAMVEAIGGWLAGSLALISDAGHMLTDAASFVVALLAQFVARRPPSTRASFGYARAEALAAFVNALGMLALVVWIAVEAVARLLEPRPVQGGLVMAVAIVGLLVNLFVAWMLSRAQGSMNARGALLHVFGDILGSVAAIVAGAVIAWTGWTPIDPLLSVAVALLILRSTIALLRESGAVLMERVPPHLSYEAIGQALARLPGVTGVHDLHVWTMTADRPSLSAHVTLVDGSRWPAVLAAAQRMLARDFDVDHVTLQPTWPVAPPGDRVIEIVQLREPGTGTRE